MKILLITEDEILISSCRKLENKETSLIVYRWFMKAMDNLEEIQPDYIIVNCEEYPRHWKIASVFANCGLFCRKIPVLLYSSNEFNDEEYSKTKALGISAIVSDFTDFDFNSVQIPDVQETVENNEFDNNDEEIPTVDAISSSFEDEEDLPTVDSILNSNSVDEEIEEESTENDSEDTVEVTSNPVEGINETEESKDELASEPDEESDTGNKTDEKSTEDSDNEYSILQNPQAEIEEINKLTKRALIPDTNNRLIIGSIRFNSLDDLKVKFIPDYIEDLNCFNSQMMIENGSYEFDNDCIAFTAKVLQKSDDDILLEFVA